MSNQAAFLKSKENLLVAGRNDFADGNDTQQIVVRADFLVADHAAGTRAGTQSHQAQNNGDFLHFQSPERFVKFLFRFKKRKKLYESDTKVQQKFSPVSM